MVKDDDDLPLTRNKKMLLAPVNLEPLSVHELEAYISELESEIVRVKNDIIAKAAQRSTAEALFKS